MPDTRKLVLSPANGTRFKIYVQSPVVTAFSEPETVRISRCRRPRSRRDRATTTFWCAGRF